MGDDEDTRDAAADAFEELRDEVAELRAAIAEFPSRMRNQTPDYTPSLAAIQQALEKIEGHPALRFTPQAYVQQVRAVVDGVRREVAPQLLDATNKVQRASAEVSRFAGELRDRRAQWKALTYAASAGLAVGATVWGMAAGPLARALPAGWRVPERMAVGVLASDRWAAGWRLMQFANPDAAQELDLASRVWAGNKPALAVCLRHAAEKHQPQTCKLTVAPAS
jgi:hypothetical protein